MKKGTVEINITNNNNEKTNHKFHITNKNQKKNTRNLRFYQL